jgi:23S rRNA maturation mini-RNase III
MGADVNIQVSQEVVKPIIEAKIQAAIVSELSKVSEQIIEQVVKTAINMKVDSNGNKSNSSYDTNPYLEWLINDIVLRMTKETLSEVIEKQKPEIKKELAKAIARQKQTIADNFVGYLIESTKDKWRTNVKIEFQKPHD